MPKCGRCLRATLVPSCNHNRELPSSYYGSSASDFGNNRYGQRDRDVGGDRYSTVSSDATGSGYNSIGADASRSSGYNPTSSDVADSGYNEVGSDASSGYNPTASDTGSDLYNARPSEKRIDLQPTYAPSYRYDRPTASDVGSSDSYNSIGNDVNNGYGQRPSDVPRTTTPYFFPFGRLTTASTPNDVTIVDERCRGVPEGDTRAVGRCRQDYIECRLGRANIRYCDGQQIFDSAMRVCAASDSVPQCSTKKAADASGGSYGFNDASSASLSAICTTRGDGYYRHPTDCQRFIQCFHGNAFVLNCASGLVFNANKDAGVCDYPVNVPECQNIAGDASAQDAECIGRPEGAFFRDTADCTVFYRCVHGQKLKFDCPETTVFNERLNVCDYPSEVPECSSTSSSRRIVN